MSNFEDFDLDLKQVSTTTNTELLSTTTILQSLATTCIYHVQHQCLWYLFDSCRGQYSQWLHLPEDCHHRRAGHTIPRMHTGNRKSLKISYVSYEAVRRCPFVLNSLVSIEASHPRSEQLDRHTSPWLFCSYHLSILSPDQ